MLSPININMINSNRLPVLSTQTGGLKHLRVREGGTPSRLGS